MNKKLIFLFLIAAALVQFACKKNDGDSGPPKITNIRVVDSTKSDSSFTSGIPGTQIVIQGSNLGGVQAIYFNDTSAYFNPVYNTSSNIIVTIPYTAQTKATRPDVPSIIRIVTDHGSVEYPFELYLNGPYITSLSFDNTGKIVTINGGNFQGVQKIVFPTPNKDTALSYTVNKDFNQVMAVIPPETALPDSVRVYCTYGVAAYVYPPPMNITSLSNENGAGGTTIAINGTNFIGISQVAFPGGVISTDITPVNVNQVNVKVPTGINSANYLTITGALGSTTSPLPFATYITHPLPGYLSTFDNQYSGSSDNSGFVGWTGGYNDQSAASTNYPGATGGVAFIKQTTAMDPAKGAGTQGNPGFIQLNPYPWVANSDESIDGYSLKFELYVATPWKAGEIWISTGDWYKWQDGKDSNDVSKSNYTARFAPWETAPDKTYKPNGWVTITIPLTQFITGNPFYQATWNPNGSPAKKFSDYISSFKKTQATALCFIVINDQAEAVPANSVDIAIDNVRIIKDH